MKLLLYSIITNTIYLLLILYIYIYYRNTKEIQNWKKINRIKFQISKFRKKNRTKYIIQNYLKKNRGKVEFVGWRRDRFNRHRSRIHSFRIPKGTRRRLIWNPLSRPFPSSSRQVNPPWTNDRWHRVETCTATTVSARMHKWMRGGGSGGDRVAWTKLDRSLDGISIESSTIDAS